MLLFFWGSCSNSPGFCHPSRPRYIGVRIRKHLEISPAPPPTATSPRRMSRNAIFTAQSRKPRPGAGRGLGVWVKSHASLEDNRDDSMVTGRRVCAVPSPRARPRHQPLAPRSPVGGHRCHVALGTWGPAQSSSFRRPWRPGFGAHPSYFLLFSQKATQASELDPDSQPEVQIPKRPAHSHCPASN